MTAKLTQPIVMAEDDDYIATYRVPTKSHKQITDFELNEQDQNTVLIQGVSKQEVGEQAARIRKLRIPNPYTGNGIKYRGEIIRRKAGKTAVGGEM